MTKPSKDNYYHYNSHLQPYAKKLRKRMTKSEACLWKFALRARKMRGFQFRRQRPVLGYIADFMCKELLLIIEVDGGSHQNHEAQVRDMQRDSVLKNAGFTTLRFSSSEVLNQMDVVVSEIA
ncbi:MAG: endonuclease domain-containing protein, partial [Saprospiraceae bacterium]|nr:endonuclease domain-containing protein [Saprospiraceae bacterium]